LKPPWQIDAAIGGAEQSLHPALDHRVVHRLVVDRLVIGTIEIEGPARRDVAFQASHVLLDSIVFVPALVGQADIAPVPQEIGRGIGARGQDRAQVLRDEGVGHRYGGELAELGQRAAAGGVDIEIDEQELAIERQVGRQVIVRLDEGGLALEAVQEIGLLAHRHAHVAVDDGIAAGVGLALVVDGAGLHEQRAVVVEAKVEQRIDCAGHAIAAEHRLHHGRVGGIGGIGHEGAGADVGRRRLVGKEAALAAVQRILVGIAEGGDHMAAILGKAAAERDRAGELEGIALR
jgi:hypothetical protein